MNYFRRFQQGSEVSYKGQRFAKELNGEMGVIDGFVEGTERGVTVTFAGCKPEDRHYIMDEVRDLDVWKSKPKVERHDKDEKEVKVEKRKGVAKGKRRNQDES